MEQVPNILEDTSTKMRSLVKRSDKFLTKDSELYEKTKLFSKVLYDVTKLIELEPSKATLPELIIQDFDPEQVWAGVEIQNQQKFSKLQSKFSSLNLSDIQSHSLLYGKPPVTSDRDVMTQHEDQEEEEEEDQLSDQENFEDEENEINNDEESEHSKEENDNSDDDILNDPDFQNMSDSDGDDLPLFDNLDEDELNDEEGDVEEGRSKSKRDDSGGGRKTEVDDQFFKMSEMEKFLDHEDKRELKKDKKKEDSDDESDLDLFDEMSGEEEMMYQDYFKNKEAADVDLADAEGSEGVDDDDEDDEDENEDDDDQSEPEGEKGAPSKLLPSSDEEEEEVAKSSHEVSKERLAKKISKLEEVAVGEKAWQMGGEVSAPVRPENSLLSEHLEYDSAARQAPVITEAVSRRLEDIILQRVKDKAWDDVERKVKPVEDPLEYKKKLVLDQEKSKLSLAQIYEEEYLKLSEEKTEKKKSVGLLDKEEEETPAEVVEIRSAMNSLFRKLDSLTHLHFTPKQKSAEVKIVRNIPSINMEEVAPVASTNAVLLAPEEVVDKKKGELMDDREKSKTDRKRDKREKKAKLKAKIKEKERKEKLVAKINPGLGNKYSKEKALRQLEEAEKQGTVINLNKKEKDLSTKNSKVFFSSLQEEMKTHVREKSSDKKRKDKSKHINVASLKL